MTLLVRAFAQLWIYWEAREERRAEQLYREMHPRVSAWKVFVAAETIEGKD